MKKRTRSRRSSGKPRTTDAAGRRAADRAVAFIQALRHSKGEWAGQRFTLEPWQENDIVRPLFGTLGDDGCRQYRTAYISEARKNGKALDVDQRVPTPDGWAAHGELRPGDVVFGEDGTRKRVIAVTPPYVGPCYRVCFSDDTEIVAHENHEWRTAGRTSLVTTGQMARQLRKGGRRDYAHMIAVAGELEIDDRQLLIPPYTLGARTVVAVEPVGARLVNCIQVEGGMYLAGDGMIPTHNSELCAAIALYLLFADGEMGAEVYSCAADKDQASIVFSVAAQMVRQSPALAKRCRIIDSTKRIVVYPTASFYRAVSSDVPTKHGLNPSGVIFDELHAQPNRQLWDVMTTGSGTRRQPLVVAITTAGTDPLSICGEQYEYAQKVLKGVIKDPRFFAYIREVPREADWTDEALWPLANPALGTFRKIDEMREFAVKAKNVPALQNTFRRFYLNQWVQQETRWLDLAKWDETAGEISTEELRGLECYAGLDLASTTDIAALVLVFPIGGGFAVLPHFWIPEVAMLERATRDRVPYDAWVRQGLITATPGNVIDYKSIMQTIAELGETYNIREIAFDRWGAAQLSQDLDGAGFVMVPFGQGFASMSAPTKELMNLVLQQRVWHGGNPVLRWMADNLVVRTDPAGNLKPDKSKSREKIDGMVALIMALDRAIRNQSAGSVYEERDLRFI